jgi:hypothetical protein
MLFSDVTSLILFGISSLRLTLPMHLGVFSVRFAYLLCTQLAHLSGHFPSVLVRQDSPSLWRVFSVHLIMRF